MFDKTILMCRPTSYDVTYEINPWMHVSNKPNKVSAMHEWTRLHHLIIRCGGYVEYIDQQPNLPDMVFTANAGMVHEGKIALSRFANKERQGERKFYREYFSHIFQESDTLLFDEGEYFEGQGDAFVINNTLFMGVNRTTPSVAGKLMDFFGLKKLVLCELINPEFYHLDTCFCPLSKGHVLFYPAAFSPDTLHAFETEAKVNWCGVNEEDAKAFVCNAVNIKEHVLIPHTNVLPAELSSKMKLWGYRPHLVHLNEFMKAGGAAKCLTLQI
jgi:ornithine--oxo-acid transaminase